MILLSNINILIKANFFPCDQQPKWYDYLFKWIYHVKE
jgi:hypothetical protein